jgi:hypothetical protein
MLTRRRQPASSLRSSRPAKARDAVSARLIAPMRRPRTTFLARWSSEQASGRIACRGSPVLGGSRFHGRERQERWRSVAHAPARPLPMMYTARRAKSTAILKTPSGPSKHRYRTLLREDRRRYPAVCQPAALRSAQYLTALYSPRSPCLRPASGSSSSDCCSVRWRVPAGLAAQRNRRPNRSSPTGLCGGGDGHVWRNPCVRYE